MSQSKVAKIYAESLYDYAVAQNNRENVITDVEKLKWLFVHSAELLRTVQSPIVRSIDKLAIIRGAAKNSLTTEFDGFINLLTKKNRIDFIPEIVEIFSDVCDKKEGVLRVTVTSAIALSDEQMQSVKDMLHVRFNKTIVITPFIDAELIGGFVVRVGDNVIDASIVNKLKQIKKKFINTSISLN